MYEESQLAEPVIFKIDPTKSEYAYSNYNHIGPCFGEGFDFTMLDDNDPNDNYCEHIRTVFQGGLHGNILCGGDRYSINSDAGWILRDEQEQ